jgi:hypothetical protein
MRETRQAIRKEIASKYFAIAGVALVVIGVLAFLNSLGSGGGYFATALVVSGIVLIIGAIVRGVGSAVSRH